MPGDPVISLWVQGTITPEAAHLEGIEIKALFIALALILAISSVSCKAKSYRAKPTVVILKFEIVSPELKGKELIITIYPKNGRQ